MVRSPLLLTALYTAAALGIACDHGAPIFPTTTAPSSGSVDQPFALCAPTPIDPEKPIAGCWVGTFDTSDPADCHTDTPATATFEQNGSAVTGTLSAYNACELDAVTFRGTLQDDHVDGSLVKGTFRGTLTGVLSGDHLELSTSDLSSGNRFTPAGTMHLHR
jgi:hypothetical protein